MSDARALGRLRLRWLLMLVAFGAMVTAVAIVVTAPSSGPASDAVSASSAGDESLSLSPSAAVTTEQPSVALWHVPLATPAGFMNLSQISHRDRDWQLPLTDGDAEAVLVWQPFPRSGEVQLVLRSSLGGRDAQRWFVAQWQRRVDGSIAFNDTVLRLYGGERAGPSPASVSAVFIGGRWQLGDIDGGSPDTLHPAFTASILDAARAIDGLAQAFMEPGQSSALVTYDVAGIPHRLWPDQWTADDLRSWFLIGPDPDNLQILYKHPVYPLSPGRWQDWRLALQPDGQWRHAMHLSGQAASAEQPGDYLRRLHLHWP